MSSNNDNKNKSVDNAGRESKYDASREDKDNTGGEDKDRVGKEGEDDNTGKHEYNVGRNSKTLNMKPRIKDVNEKLKWGEIATGKLAFGYIGNPLVDISAFGTIVPHYLTVPLVVLLVLPVSFDFPTFGYSSPDPLIFFVPGLPIFPCFGTFIVFLVDLDTFCYDLFFATFIDDSIVKLLVKVIAHLLVIAHPSYNGYTSKEASGISFEFGFVNLFLSINLIFDK